MVIVKTPNVTGAFSITFRVRLMIRRERQWKNDLNVPKNPDIFCSDDQLRLSMRMKSEELANGIVPIP
jgi:hypothetical protein